MKPMCCSRIVPFAYFQIGFISCCITTLLVFGLHSIYALFLSLNLFCSCSVCCLFGYRIWNFDCRNNLSVVIQLKQSDFYILISHDLKISLINSSSTILLFEIYPTGRTGFYNLLILNRKP